MQSSLFQIYDTLILRHPRSALFIILLFSLSMALGLPKFKLDASADSLTLENDDDLNLLITSAVFWNSIINIASIGIALIDKLSDFLSFMHEYKKMDKVISEKYNFFIKSIGFYKNKNFIKWILFLVVFQII